MSPVEESLKVVTRGVQATLAQDWSTAAELLSPDVEIHDFDVPDAGVFHGHSGFEAWLERWGEGWESWRMENPQIRPAGEDAVLVLFRIVVQGAGSGIEIARDDAILYHVAAGQIVRMEYFNDQLRALEAAGLDR